MRRYAVYVVWTPEQNLLILSEYNTILIWLTSLWKYKKVKPFGRLINYLSKGDIVCMVKYTCEEKKIVCKLYIFSSTEDVEVLLFKHF